MTAQQRPETAQPLPTGGSSTKKAALPGVSMYGDDVSFSSEGGSDAIGGKNSSNKNKNLDAGMIATKETRALFISRIIVGFVLVAAGLGAGVLTYFITANGQEEDFENHFVQMADEIFAASNSIYNGAAGAFVTMSTTMTAFSASTPTEWPFYTHLDFEAFGYSYLTSTGAELVSWSPVVEGDLDRGQWGSYSFANDAWVEDGLRWRAENLGEEMPEPPYDVPGYIYRRDVVVVPETGDGPFAPIWQMSGAPTDASLVNFNLLSDEVVGNAWSGLKRTGSQVLSDFVTASDFYGAGATSKEIPNVPQSLLLTPMFSDFDYTNMVGAVVAVLSWNLFLQDILQEGYGKVFAVVSSGECGSEYTFEVEGPNVSLMGEGNLHDPTYKEYEMVSEFASSSEVGTNNPCDFVIKIYPSQELHDVFITKAPVNWTIFIGAIFLVLALGFLIYDMFVQKRQNKVVNDAARSNAIVTSLFPADVRDRLFGKDSKEDKDIDYHSHLPENSKFRLKNYLAEEDGNNQDEEEPLDEAVARANANADVYETKPIADLFPNTTVMFADIAGFTAWSSVREPSQVFTLLETVYRAFDAIAKRRRVFKVETVGDCYVAVTGLPEPRKDHAVVMAKFARECLDKFNELAKQLEITLGPDTADLAMRAGLHSGPVTAGVLRGDKSRFQLFGDTVNTAARVEGTGMRNRVHLSSDTAELLKEAGKDNWLRKRHDAVTAKGKGSMDTWWLVNPNDKNEDFEEKKENDDGDRVAVLGQRMKHLSNEELFGSLPPKTQRLVGWNVEILKKILQHLIAKRSALPDGKNYDTILTKKEGDLRRRLNCLDEVTEIIHLPKFNARAHRNRGNPSKIEVPEIVMEQLKNYVAAVAAMHRENPFHNFEHASHVTMSVSKLLSRIVAPDEILNQDDNSNLASNLHDHTYGITSDPLTHFAVVLSALIHDTDHLGVSNFQLIKEDHKLAKFFKSKSIAEQNSIVVAWERLMEPQFLELRRTIYGDPSELDRFRQIVVNNVLATDIFDKELTAIRRKRWDHAFAKNQTQASPEDDVNRKATIVMEHLIQASDVAHTMQHWHIYHKWNERLFQEMITAYQAGRMEKNPAEGWYKGELGFFDNYIIPLAKKLKECGVFGVSSDEYLNYALENRREWASKGEEVLAKYVDKYQVKRKEEETKTEDVVPKGKSGADSTDGGVTVTTETSDSTEGK